MKIDGNIGMDLRNVAQNARDVEAAGYSGAWTAETSHDPFLPLLLAAEHTTNLEIGTSIAVAFARNPMTLANTAWDLQAYSQGRFILGLGSQIKPHITKRFSMEWSKPAARMREMILAMRAIWNTWLTGEKLDFRGEFYTHTLMTPFFTPSRIRPRRIRPAEGLPRRRRRADDRGRRRGVRRIHLPRFHHREVPPRGHDPALERGRAKAGKTMEGFEIVGPSFVVTGNNDEEIGAAATGHPPADRVLRLDAGLPQRARDPRLGRAPGRAEHAVEAGRVAEMGTLIDDEILNTFAVVGAPEQIAPELAKRYGDVIQRISFYAPYSSDPDRWQR